MAAGEPIRFRCSRCKQLIGVVRSKAGTAIACPKCGANLIVPPPDAPPSSAMPPQAPPDPAETDEFVPGLGVAISPAVSTGREDESVPLDALDIRIEDIQIEPGVRSLVSPQRPPRPYRPSPVTGRPAEPPGEPPIAPAPVDEVVAPGRDLSDEAPALTVGAPPEPDRAAPVDIPPLVIDVVEPDGRRARPVEPARVRDIVLPRSVVASWSLLVLVAVAFAFLAGLLIGHFVWRIH